MDLNHSVPRRDVLTAAATAFTTSLFTGNVKGANNRIAVGFITIFVNRSGCWVIPNAKSKLAAAAWEKNAEMAQMNLPHWQNFVECIKSREKPTSDIETCVRSSAVCLLGNLAMRSKTRLDWDETNWTVQQEAVKPFLKARYRSPWKLEV